MVIEAAPGIQDFKNDLDPFHFNQIEKQLRLAISALGVEMT